MLKFHDLKLEKLDLSKSKKIIFVFPHPDDETMMCGGTINKCTKSKEVHVISTTRGENGIEKLNIDEESLGKIRSTEFSSAMKELGVKNYKVLNFKDGGTLNQADEMKQKIEKYIAENDIDTIFTYERTGVYPHPDHITLSNVVRQIVKGNPSVVGMYSTLPQKIRNIFKLPKKITFRDSEVNLEDLKPCLAECKVFVLGSIIPKYKAALKYKSQKLNKTMPIWAKMLFMPFEYYSLTCGEDLEHK